MRVFVTGATGFVGSAIARELLANGHQVLGLARSNAAAEAVAALGAEVQRGSLDDPDSLRSGAEAAEGVIHTAAIHDFSDLDRAGEADRRAIETFGAVLAGSGRPLVVTSVIGLLSRDRTGTEEDAPDINSAGAHRIASEEAALALASGGVRVSVVRLPSVHGEGDHGFVPALINLARAKSVSAYPGDGSNRWAAVHRLDAAHLYRLALETAPAGTRFHAVAEEGVPVRDIVAVIGHHLDISVKALPADESAEHFGWLYRFISNNMVASSALTRQQLGWHPAQPGLLADLDQDYYFKTAGDIQLHRAGK